MAWTHIKQKCARCHLVNVATAQSMECLLNPKQWSEKVQVNWNRATIPGLSYQPLQYQSTSNRQITDLEFYLDKVHASEQPGDADILRFRRFLRELTIPRTYHTPACPPRVLFVWPGVLTLEGVITELSLSYQQFANDGSVVIYTANCTIEEACTSPRKVE